MTALMLVGALAGCAEEPAVAPEGPALAGIVSEVVDGDTVRVRIGGETERVRLVGIDTPEVARPDTPVQCGGPEASAYTRGILPAGALVRLVTDPTQDRRDRFGRLLAYVYREGRAGPRGSVNYALVAGGYARRYVFGGRPFRYAEAFGAAERAARARGTGVWGPGCAGPGASARESGGR